MSPRIQSVQTRRQTIKQALDDENNEHMRPISRLKSNHVPHTYYVHGVGYSMDATGVTGAFPPGYATATTNMISPAIDTFPHSKRDKDYFSALKMSQITHDLNAYHRKQCDDFGPFVNCVNENNTPLSSSFINFQQ